MRAEPQLSLLIVDDRNLDIRDELLNWNATWKLSGVVAVVLWISPPRLDE
jgi:hypothetical protein